LSCKVRKGAEYAPRRSVPSMQRFDSVLRFPAHLIFAFVQSTEEKNPLTQRQTSKRCGLTVLP
jgi:hypothetical protein